MKPKLNVASDIRHFWNIVFILFFFLWWWVQFSMLQCLRTKRVQHCWRTFLCFLLEDCLNVERETCSQPWLLHFIIFQVFHLSFSDILHTFGITRKYQVTSHLPAVFLLWFEHEVCMNWVFSIDRSKSQMAIFCINIYMFICVSSGLCFVDIFVVYYSFLVDVFGASYLIWFSNSATHILDLNTKQTALVDFFPTANCYCYCLASITN